MEHIHWKVCCWHRTHQDQVLSTKEIDLPQRDRGQGVRDREEIGNEGEGEGNEEGVRMFVLKGLRTASG